ncbi:MAG: UDP-N-acetylmuramoyl-L-alanyl-D-glutamate--2,6-diaminopimelate ligase, partial [Gammaproteobacteria bacterium]
YELGEAAAALGGCAPPPGRMELLRAEGMPGVVVDYAHTPDALQRALESLRALCRGRLWAVFGCGGGRDHGKRARMGAVAEAGAARVILTDDNPRFEDPAQITAHIAAGMREPPLIIHGRRRAIHAALAAAAPEDMVLLAGKGHETTQDRGAQALHFNDREAVMDALGIAESGAPA